MNERRALDQRGSLGNYEMALKGLDKASEIAVKLGMYPCDVNRLKEQELKELRHYYLKRM